MTTRRFNCFADWCRHQDELSPEARHTVEVLLELAGTSDGDEAERILSSRTELYLSDNQISDITPLSGLTHLTCLHLDNNQISDITPLSGLTHLTLLYLHHNQISHITSLSGLTTLTLLSLDGNKISDITPLSGLTHLTTLGLSSNEISNITLLSGLTHLTSLELYNNKISDITPLSDLTNLEILFLDNNQISDITPLFGLTNLEELHLDNNQTSDITPLSGLTHLTWLALNKNQNSDITPLSDLTNLEILFLDNNQISDITPLSGLINLGRLSLENNQISDITLLFGLTELDESLRLDNNPIPNLKLLQALQQQWRNLSTEPIARQQAIVAVKSAYAIIDQAEPEIIFVSSPNAALVSLAGCETLGEPLAEMLYDAAKKPQSQALWYGLRDQMPFQLGWEVEGQLCQQLRDDGRELKFEDDGRVRKNDITPEDLVELISITEFCISECGCVLEEKEAEALRCLKQLFLSCGWIFPYENVCVVCDRPRIFSFDTNSRAK